MAETKGTKIPIKRPPTIDHAVGYISYLYPKNY